MSSVAPVSTLPAAVPKSAFVAQMGALAALRPKGDPSFLEPLRAQALARFTERGLPTTRDEDWRFTSVAAIARTAFARPDPAATTTATAADLAALRLPDCAAELVFVDGVFAPGLSHTETPAGLSVESLRAVLAGDASRLEPHLAHVLPQPNAFADLNTALFEDGALVVVQPGARVAGPVHLVFVSTSKGLPTASHPRVLVLCGAGSEATLVETYAGLPGASGLTCAVTEALVDENASLRRYKVQDESPTAFHVSSFGARTHRHARLSDFSVSLGAALSRHDLHVDFAAEGGEAVLEGLFYADGERHTDTHTLIDHARPHCTSRELYKGIVGGRGQGVFSGKVLVRAGAQKTDAAQTNRNLLLSREALVHSIPQLEILADDVKCRHGATTGQLDEMALFYLRSRGLSEAAARGLLTVAFASDLVHRITLPVLRERVSARLVANLPGAGEAREAVL
ncbi:MAG TPA: Fe-S cluster assembly protein SufD [Vicinamibacteria bacterium]|nr:Fe-S cluster assembly protein SufD [Vicinamibacteria bacterium]